MHFFSRFKYRVKVQFFALRTHSSSIFVCPCRSQTRTYKEIMNRVCKSRNIVGAFFSFQLWTFWVVLWSFAFPTISPVIRLMLTEPHFQKPLLYAKYGMRFFISSGLVLFFKEANYHFSTTILAFVSFSWRFTNEGKKRMKKERGKKGRNLKSSNNVILEVAISEFPTFTSLKKWNEKVKWMLLSSDVVVSNQITKLKLALKSDSIPIAKYS